MPYVQSLYDDPIDTSEPSINLNNDFEQQKMIYCESEMGGDPTLNMNQTIQSSPDPAK